MKVAHILANGLIVAQMLSPGSTPYYYENDALGSTRLVTSSTGAILYSSDYLPYGASFGTSGSFNPEFEYTGKLFDSSIDLYYYGARFYDPTTDRFVTEDTLTGSLDDPLSLNRYVYARDDPETLIDPSGHMFAYPYNGASYIPYAIPSTQSDYGYWGNWNTEQWAQAWGQTSAQSSNTYQRPPFWLWVVQNHLQSLANLFAGYIAPFFGAQVSPLAEAILSTAGATLALEKDFQTIASDWSQGNA